jgi:hypothetical protein
LTRDKEEAMNTFRIEAEMVRTQPDLRPLGEHLLGKILAWYEDPDHEREYQEWKAGREGKR